MSAGWRWYANRLGRMSAREVMHRARRAVRGVGRKHGFFCAEQVPPADLAIEGIALLREPGELDPEVYVKEAESIAAGHIPTLGDRTFQLDDVGWNGDAQSGKQAPLAFAGAIDYRDAAQVGDIKYVWEHNRHHHLVTLAQAWHLTKEPAFLQALKGQLASWFDACPYLQGPNWCSALELGIRLINWSAAWQLAGGRRSPLFEGAEGEAFRSRWLGAVYQHAHTAATDYSRFSSANNHLVGEAAGVYIAACTWPHWAELRRWGSRAKGILENQIRRQFYLDGVNAEQATSYQRFSTELFLLAALAGKHAGQPFSMRYWAQLEASMGFMASLMDAGGHLPMVGDSDDAVVLRLDPSPEACPTRALLSTGACLFERPQFSAKAERIVRDSRWLLGAGARHRASPRGRTLPQRRFPLGGYFILGDQFETDGEVKMVVDAGPLGYRSIAAHGHADALAVTLSLGGRPVLVDPGTYVYHAEPRWRSYFRGTAAHNTVRVDEEEQSMSGGPFMWIHHATARCERFLSTPERDYFRGVHDGYHRLRDPVTHRRIIDFDKRGHCFTFNDVLICRGAHRLEIAWHLAEGCVAQAQGNRVHVENGAAQFELITEGEGEWHHLRGDSDAPGGWIAPRFGCKVPTSTLVWRRQIRGTEVVSTRLDYRLNQGERRQAVSAAEEVDTE